MKKIFYTILIVWLFAYFQANALDPYTDLASHWVVQDTWVNWIQNVLWAIIKYATYIAWLAWVLFIVINWILYSTSWYDAWAKDQAKQRIIKTLIWLIVLLLSWTILHILAPWIYK